MLDKKYLRKKYFNIRKKKYFEVKNSYFNPIKKIINKLSEKKSIYISFYFPSNYEVNTLNFLASIKKKKYITLLPAIFKKKYINFYKWKNLDILKVNHYGMLEPIIEKQKSYIPDIMLVPLLAFDNQNNRLGYGKGFYDTFLNKYLSLNKKIITVGVAFSFQKYKKLPIYDHDVKLNFILTEKGLQK